MGNLHLQINSQSKKVIMRKMSIAREIKIQRLQNKSRMTGQTFNPGGHTSESLKEREIKLVSEVKAMPEEKQLELYRSYKAVDKMKNENNIYCSNSFEHNAFMRNFGHKFMYEENEAS